MESEQRTLALVNDVANTLESVAVNSSHTPALYSTFLRAVVTARTAGPSQPPSPRVSSAPNSMDIATFAHAQLLQQQQKQQQSGQGNSPLDMQLASNPAAGVFGDEHQFGDGALGLKMFPPSGSAVLGGGSGSNGQGGVPGTTPASGTPGGDMIWNPNASSGASGVQIGNGHGELDLQAAMSFQLPNPPQGDDFASLSMDNILSGGFWDNVLIPGLSSFLAFPIVSPVTLRSCHRLTDRLLSLGYSNSGLEALSGGFVYGSSGSGFITPRRSSPEPDANSALLAGMPGMSNGFGKP